MLFSPKRHLTLTSFVPGKGNQHARAAGIQFIGAEQTLPNVLLVAGRPGSGKSHLLHALANFAKQNRAIRSITFLSAIQFADEIMRAYFYRDLSAVIRNFAKGGVLAVDDVDRLLHQPVIADALLEIMQLRQAINCRTLLTVTMCLAPAEPHRINEFLGNQPTVKLI